MADKANTLHVSPVALLKFGNISRPSKEYNSYSAKLVFEPNDPDWLKFKAFLDDLHEKAMHELVEEDGKYAKYRVVPPYSPELDEDEEETGRFVVSFSNKASGKRKDGTLFDVKLVVCDAKKNIIDPAIQVGRGSKVRVAFQSYPYAMKADKKRGLGLRLKQVQVIDLVVYGGGDPVFDETDGYVGTPVSAFDGDSPAPADAGNDGDY